MWSDNHYCGLSDKVFRGRLINSSIERFRLTTGLDVSVDQSDQSLAFRVSLLPVTELAGPPSPCHGGDMSGLTNSNWIKCPRLGFM